MTDVNGVTLREPDPIEAAKYVDGGGKVIAIPPKGVYTLVTTALEWGATKDDYLQATLTHVVQAPGQPYDQHEVRYHRVSTKKWPNREGSPIGDYCRAHGLADLPTGNAGYQQTLPALLNRPFEAGLDWEIYNQEKGLDIKGMEAFPDAEGGGKQPWVPDPRETGRRVFARSRVSFMVSKVAK